MLNTLALVQASPAGVPDTGFNYTLIVYLLGAGLQLAMFLLFLLKPTPDEETRSEDRGKNVPADDEAPSTERSGRAFISKT